MKNESTASPTRPMGRQILSLLLLLLLLQHIIENGRETALCLAEKKSWKLLGLTWADSTIQLSKCYAIPSLTKMGHLLIIRRLGILLNRWTTEGKDISDSSSFVSAIKLGMTDTSIIIAVHARDLGKQGGKVDREEEKMTLASIIE